MRWKPTLGAFLFIAATPVAVFELLSPVGSMVVVLVGVGAGVLLVPGFWRSSLHGAIGGVAAGLLVLGPGLRIAMRVVAILDPVRSPEFTVGGTMLIIIGVGVVMGYSVSSGTSPTADRYPFRCGRSGPRSSGDVDDRSRQRAPQARSSGSGSGLGSVLWQGVV